MSNKRDLNSYVRFDGNGRIVPGSNILARKKPKVGNWVEGPAYLCCSSDFSVYVCGAGTEAVNGRYFYAGMRHGKPYYKKGTFILSWGDYPPLFPGYQDWEIYDPNVPDTWYYYSTDTVYTPDLVTTWHADDGDSPAPTVQLTDCLSNTTTTTTTTEACTATFVHVLAGGFELAEGACASWGGDTANFYTDNPDFGLSTVLYNFADCVGPGNGYYAGVNMAAELIVRQCIDGVLGPAVPCATTTTTTTIL